MRLYLASQNLGDFADVLVSNGLGGLDVLVH